MSAPTMSTDQMLAALRVRALRVCSLSLEINVRGIAQAFVDVYGHTHSMYADLRPADTVFPENGEPRPEIANLNLRFYAYDFHDHEEQQEDMQEQADAADQYIAYLELLLAKGQPVTVADVGSEAA
ncbi:hypothetical protein [Marinobacter oulmenensis]|uniref:Uncharacterized protein n=1 Tax=Marinobacter oulmenensis TaxID=643747 RepID=A0A840U8A1_9GAMM|nr:hypothetical protein [Marinobacter oulmenensis]MBB5321192.1 hypothetical protein [Marinobacter oulmenensis]